MEKQVPKFDTVNMILKSARELKISSDDFRQTGHDQWKKILKKIFDKFANTSDTNILWIWENNFKNVGVSIQTDNGLYHIDKFFSPETKVWLLFNNCYDNKKNGNYWVFEGNYGPALEVIGNSYCDEYYIVDRKLNWMLMENHHHYLMAVGEPAESRLLDLKKLFQTANESY